jgi:lipopolysaccharide biosynthesis glycosyltransferase
LLLTSLKFFSKIDSFDILILTNENMRAEVEELSRKLKINIKIQTFDFKTIFQAACARLFIFDYPEIDHYEKIIYVDADSIFIKDPVTIFDAIQEDLVYVLGEGNILCDAEYWGRSLFLKENAQYVDREGLSSCVLGFKNIPAIKKMFIKTKQAFYLDMYQNKLRFYDQPFLNFYFIYR